MISRIIFTDCQQHLSHSARQTCCLKQFTTDNYVHKKSPQGRQTYLLNYLWTYFSQYTFLFETLLAVCESFLFLHCFFSCFKMGKASLKKIHSVTFRYLTILLFEYMHKRKSWGNVRKHHSFVQALLIIIVHMY